MLAATCTSVAVGVIPNDECCLIAAGAKVPARRALADARYAHALACCSPASVKRQAKPPGKPKTRCSSP